MEKSRGTHINIIERWEEDEKDHVCNKELKYMDEFLGSNLKRTCTDVFCLIFFVLSNAGLIGAGFYIFYTGDIDRLGHGSDFRGEVCGIKGLYNRTYAYYPTPSDPTIALCMNSCPNKVVSQSVCYYDTDHTTLLPVWGCWDSIPCTSFAYYCFPQGEAYRKSVLDVFFYDQNLIKRGGGDIIYVIYQ
jgi:hypothetical protein